MIQYDCQTHGKDVQYYKPDALLEEKLSKERRAVNENLTSGDGLQTLGN